MQLPGRRLAREGVLEGARGAGSREEPFRPGFDLRQRGDRSLQLNPSRRPGREKVVKWGPAAWATVLAAALALPVLTLFRNLQVRLDPGQGFPLDFPPHVVVVEDVARAHFEELLLHHLQLLVEPLRLSDRDDLVVYRVDD